MNAYTLRIIVDVWMPRIAAGFTGAMVALAVSAAFNADWILMGAWAFAVCASVNWWACARRIAADRATIERLEALAWRTVRDGGQSDA